MKHEETERSDPLAAMREARVVPVVRTSARETAARAVELLRAEGLAIFEITLTTPGALDLIGELAREPGLLIGAGTVMTGDEASGCIEAGARFVVSPAVRPDVAARCRDAGVPVFLGAATPSEVAAAHELGSAAVKIFPAAQLGGPAFLAAIASVFPDVPLMPTGGISAGDVRAYLDRGAVCVGMGGRLVDEKALLAGDDAAIAAAAREVADALAG